MRISIHRFASVDSPAEREAHELQLFSIMNNVDAYQSFARLQSTTIPQREASWEGVPNKEIGNKRVQKNTIYLRIKAAAWPVIFLNTHSARTEIRVHNKATADIPEEPFSERCGYTYLCYRQTTQRHLRGLLRKSSRANDATICTPFCEQA